MEGEAEKITTDEAKRRGDKEVDNTVDGERTEGDAITNITAEPREER